MLVTAACGHAITWPVAAVLIAAMVAGVVLIVAFLVVERQPWRVKR